MKKITFTLALLFSICFHSFSQNANNGVEIFTIVEEMPLFNGAKDKTESNNLLTTYLKERVDKESTTEKGTVEIQFIIDESGSPTSLKIIRSISEELDNLTISYIQEMPSWEAGKQRDEKVKVQYTIPVYFK